jgi:hypothetical protein
LVPFLVMLLPLTPAGAAIGGRGFVWVNADRVDLTLGSSVEKYDLTGQVTFVPPAAKNPAHGRGIAVTSGGIVWYTVLLDIGPFVPVFVGDGLIHRTDTAGNPLPAIPDPGGFPGPGIGALDDTRKLLWAIDFNPGLVPHTVYGLDLATGAVMARCLVTNTSSPSVTLAVSGRTFLTDQGSGWQLFKFQLPTAVTSSGCIAVGDPFPLPFRIVGMDIAKGGTLLAADEAGVVHDLGGAPYDPSLGAFDTPATGAQDISAVSR